MGLNSYIFKTTQKDEPKNTKGINDLIQKEEKQMGKEAFNERLKACARELSQIPHDKVKSLYIGDKKNAEST